MAAACLLLVGLAFIQAPGLQVADTKFDLVVDPLGFLRRAVHLWDPGGAFGQLQNQSYGYLWPMGPFFAALHEVAVPGWVVQRLWLALVLCVALVGAARLVRALGVRSDVAVLLAAFAYALSPRMLSTSGPISIEAWPSALAPWVLVPLVLGSRAGSARRYALAAGTAVAMVGGVNAAATFAVLPLGIVWVLTRRPGPRRRTLLLWWPLFTALGTLWWLVPLFVLGVYSPPFLDYIETASVTTFPTTPFDVLRGTTAWIPYLDAGWRGGHELLTAYGLQLNTGLVMVLGLAGLAMRDNPHRRFLGWSLATGLVLVSLGHHGAVQGWFASPLGSALDHVLAPMRNVHKFDPVVRLPMVVGLGWAVDAAVRRSTRVALPWRGRRLHLPTHVSVVGLALVGVVGAAVPALDGHLTPVPPTLSTPAYWEQAVSWLDHRPQRSVAVLAPGTGFADYLWGSPRDEPVQYLSARDWAVRSAVPLTPPGNIRMLDALEGRFQQGQGSPGLAAYLRRAGIGYLVVRNDLRPGDDVPSSVLVHRVLADSPGLSRVVGFGPVVGGGASLSKGDARLLVDHGWENTARAVEVFRVDGAVDVVSGATPTRVVGGPEDLLGLADAGLLPQGATELAMDAHGTAPTGPWVLTDGFGQRERFFGRRHDGSSSILTAGDRRRSGNPTPDYLPPGSSRWFTRARLVGASSVSASSSRSDSQSTGGARPENLPFAALDGDPASQWVSSEQSVSDRPWWSVRLSSRQRPAGLRITLGQGGAATSRVRVLTDSGVSRTVELERGETREVGLPAGPTRSLRVEAVGPQSGRLALAEVTWAGRRTARPLVLPPTPESWGAPQAILLRTLADTRTGCVPVEGRTPCVEGRDVGDEEPRGFDRVVRLPRAASYAARLTARPVAGPALESALQQGLLVSANGSSVAVPDPRAAGLAAIDGDPGTSWTPRSEDSFPQLTLAWAGRRAVSGLTLAVAPDAPVRRPTSGLLRSADGDRRFTVDREGRARFRAVTTDRITLSLGSDERAASIDGQGVGSALPVGVGEVTVTGLPRTSIDLDATVRRWPCGTGPTLEVNGTVRRTSLVASLADLYAMRSVSAAPCEGSSVVELPAGVSSVRSRPGSLAVADRLALGTAPATPEPSATRASGSRETGRALFPAAGSRLLVERRNHNDGWRATQGGRPVKGVIVDGWQQGWATDGSTTPVRTSFAPDRTYRLGLLGGGAAFLLLILVSAVPRRRWAGRGDPAVAGRGSSTLVQAGVALLVGGLLGGWPGFLVAAIGAAAAVGLRRTGSAAAWLIAAPVLLAATAYAVRPWGDPQGWAGSWAWPAYLVLLAVAGVLVTGEEPSHRWRRRRAGSSTRR